MTTTRRERKIVTALIALAPITVLALTAGPIVAAIMAAVIALLVIVTK